MGKTTLLTAVILTFNHEAIIERCIKSIIEQKTDYPYEIHIYDDCSKDGNLEVCKKYAEKYSGKIKLFAQPENTFLKPYKETQAFKAIQGVNTKYFCIIEGDDYWCDENKIQIALDFLENNPEYIGFAHDTLQVNEFDGSEKSWVHGLAKYKIENPIIFDDNFVFLMTSSRIFRNCGFKDVGIWPVDYLVYNYHLEKGPIYYYDKIMAVYTYGHNGTFSTLRDKKIKDMNGMFAYKVSCLFDFKHDDICTKMQKWYDTNSGAGLEYYSRLLVFKKIFGIRWGWKLWFICRFVLKYGFESMDLNYVYPRKSVKKQSDKKYLKGQICDKSDKSVLDGKLSTLDIKHKLYCANKNSVKSKEEFLELLEGIISLHIRNSIFVGLEKLQEKYPEAQSIIINLLAQSNCRLNQRITKYKKQRRFCAIIIIFLSIINLTLILHGLGVFK